MGKARLKPKGATPSQAGLLSPAEWMEQRGLMVDPFGRDNPFPHPKSKSVPAFGGNSSRDIVEQTCRAENIFVGEEIGTYPDFARRETVIRVRRRLVNGNTVGAEARIDEHMLHGTSEKNATILIVETINRLRRRIMEDHAARTMMPNTFSEVAEARTREERGRLSHTFDARHYIDSSKMKELRAAILSNTASDLSPANGEGPNHTKLGKAGD